MVTLKDRSPTVQAHHAATAAWLPAAIAATPAPLAPDRFFLHVVGIKGVPEGPAMSIDIKPHAYDPAAQPELFDGVLPRRVVAFVIDFIIIAVVSIPLAVLLTLFIFALGIITFGIGWALFVLIWPALVVWAVVYFGMTLGGPASATIGMRMMDLELRTWYGAPSYFVLGAVHAIAFWISVSALTPLILFVAFFNDRRRLLHDIVLGTIVINNAQRANLLRAGAVGAPG
jgi:uncharacterized RDD family membrane protein YckC